MVIRALSAWTGSAVGITLSLCLVSCVRESSDPEQRVVRDRAWIVWEEDVYLTPRESVQWDILGSYATFEGCQRERRRALTRAMDSLKTLQQQHAGVEDFRLDDDETIGTIWVNDPPQHRAGLAWARHRLMCLPDTIDPTKLNLGRARK